MNIKIIDNFLDKEYFDKIQSHIESGHFPWNYMDNITTYAGSNKIKDPDLCRIYDDLYDGSNKIKDLGLYGFNRYIINPHDKPHDLGVFNHLIYEMMRVIGLNIFRSRLDMTVNRENSIVLDPHVDVLYPHISSILYINDSDGNTIIYNQKYNDYDKFNQQLTVQKEIEPRANRLLIFDGMYIHTGCTPSKHNRRILINSNFK
jgi:hypothetical protein